jgi:type II secretory pathway component PulF
MSLARDKEFFSANLSLLLKAAVPIGEAIDSLVETAQSRQMKKKLTRMKQAIDDGETLTTALEQTHLVSRQTLTLVELGEESGSLSSNLTLAAEQEQKQRIFRSKLRSAMMYPAFVLGMTLVVGLGIAWFLLPRLAETFDQLGADLPPISVAMINVGLFLRDNGIWAVPGFFGVLFLLILLVSSVPALKRLGQRMVLHLPGIGRLARELEIARFGYMMGTLLEAGLPVTKALSLLEKASGSPRYQKLFHHLGVSIDKGMNFRQSFASFPHIDRLLPVSARQVVIAGEDSGSLSQTLRLVGTTYDEKVEATTRNFEVIIEPILLVGVWIGVLLVAVAVILPIYSLIGGLNA